MHALVRIMHFKWTLRPSESHISLSSGFCFGYHQTALFLITDLFGGRETHIALDGLSPFCVAGSCRPIRTELLYGQFPQLERRQGVKVHF